MYYAVIEGKISEWSLALKLVNIHVLYNGIELDNIGHVSHGRQVFYLHNWKIFGLISDDSS